MDLVISKMADKPIYLQIYDQISSQILRGEIKVGTQLPPIRTVAVDLRISVIPVKQAWECLDSNGYIITSPGRGTFVAEIKSDDLDKKRNTKVEKLIKSFIDECKSMGLDKDSIVDIISKSW